MPAGKETTNLVDLGSTLHLVDCAIRSLTDGETRAYLLGAAQPNWGVNERTIRKDCAELPRRAFDVGAVAFLHHTLRSIKDKTRGRD